LNPASYLAAKFCAPKKRRTPDSRLVTEIRRLRTTDLALFNHKLADWLVFYNAERPHHSLSQQSPLSFLLEHQS
jgi:transposase InsO family protein